MPDGLWREQVAYYRRRAAEYDATSYGDLASANTRIAALVDQLHPAGDVLEIACGTGMWTQHLAAYARAVTAIDAAPEMIALARQRVTRGQRGLRHHRHPDPGTAAAFRHHLLRLLALARARLGVRPVLVAAAQRARQQRPRPVC
jgi:SAM-dependent methyltransferase